MSAARHSPATDAFWSIPAADLLASLAASPEGFGAAEAGERLARCAPNTLGTPARRRVFWLLVHQFGSPIVLLLIGAALLSVLVHDRADGAVILAIVIASGLLGFWQEFDAGNTVAALLARVEPLATVLRDGCDTAVPVATLVPGDVVVLKAGSSIPADCRVLTSRDLFVNEAALTGESYPVEKSEGVLPAAAPLGQRTNALFMGTHAVSGTARAVVVRTGGATEFGRIASRLRHRRGETDFDRGVRRFGYFLVEVTLLLVTAIFALNVYLHKPVLDSFLFALALAVGLTPQLLPAIVSVNLARGARHMASQKVIVKRLTAIENIGSMDVLCSDKTGTLTEGRVRVQTTVDVLGRDCQQVAFHAFLNATFQTGYTNPIDSAIAEHRRFDLDAWTRIDEIPYDFIRRRLSVLATDRTRTIMVSKGSLAAVLDACSHVETQGTTVPIADARDGILRLQRSFEERGLRTLGVAVREMHSPAHIGRDDERDMLFLGLVVLSDPPKAGIARVVASLERLGVGLKIITGDSAIVAEQVARQIGLEAPVVLRGNDLQAMSDEALPVQVARANVFSEVEPGQKERIIRALRRTGHVVGYMGDGINDAPALRAADVSISVQEAADVAKEAADIVLLEQDLGVLEAGVREGRRTFANTLKYVFMATSANFGNMFSMAGASVLLPFLPLLPKQILLLNVLTDLPELGISTDRVEPDAVARPQRWNVGLIRNFMLLFGLLSSVFDYATFATLHWWLHASPAQFRTGWFVESVVSAALIVVVIRTKGSIAAAPPSMPLAAATAGVVTAAVVLPFTPLASVFGFTTIPLRFLAAMATIVTAYIAAAEGAKRWFYRSSPPRRQPSEVRRNQILTGVHEG
jgi:Mg2+-importing ATPase